MTNKAAVRSELTAAIITSLQSRGLITPKEAKQVRDNTSKKTSKT